MGVAHRGTRWLMGISVQALDRQVTRIRKRRTKVGADKKATAEDAIGAKILVAREPNHFNLRNDARFDLPRT